MKQEEKPQHAYEEKKATKQEMKDRQRRQARRQRQTKQFVQYVIALAVISGVGFGLFLLLKEKAPLGQDYSTSIPELGRGHIEVGSPRPSYNSNPPSSGPHYAETARTGFRKEAIPDEHIVHNLEHGDIWITFHPRISDEVKDKLKGFAGGKVIVTPREANDFDISLVAWGRLDSFNITDNVLDEQRIEDFIKKYMNQGPEKLGPSAGQGGV